MRHGMVLNELWGGQSDVVNRGPRYPHRRLVLASIRHTSRTANVDRGVTRRPLSRSPGPASPSAVRTALAVYPFLLAATDVRTGRPAVDGCAPLRPIRRRTSPRTRGMTCVPYKIDVDNEWPRETGPSHARTSIKRFAPRVARFGRDLLCHGLRRHDIQRPRAAPPTYEEGFLVGVGEPRVLPTLREPRR